MNMKAIIMELSSQEDVAKIHELLAEALGEMQEQKAKDIEGIACKCENPNCIKRIHAERMKDGRVAVVLSKGPNIVQGIVVDVDGAKDLVEQLLNAIGGQR